MADSPPDFANQLDPSKFNIKNAQSISSGLDNVKAGANNVNFDWSSVHDLLGQLAGGPGAAFDAKAKGEGNFAGQATAMGQEDLGAASGASASKLGHALMQLGSKAATQQAGQVAGAQSGEQLQNAQKAQQLKQAEVQARMNIYKQELALQNQKFEINNAATQAQNGLQTAQLQLQNMYNQAVSKAKNAKDLGEIQAQHNNFNNIMQYVSMGLGTVSTLAAAGAQQSVQGDAKLGAAYNGETLPQMSASSQNLAANYASNTGDPGIAALFGR